MDENQVVVYNGNKITLSTPDVKSVHFVVYTRPKDEIIFDFDIKELKVDLVRGDLHIIFPSGSTITIASLLALGFSDSPVLMYDKSGKKISLDEFLQLTEVVVYNQATLILANRDEFKMSSDKPDVVLVATDQDSTLEAGIPITGVGESDVVTKGVPSNLFDPRGIVVTNGAYSGQGFYVITLNFSDNPFNLDKDQLYPGNTTVSNEPILDYYVYYGSKLINVANEGSNYLTYQYSNGYDYTSDSEIQASQNSLDLSGETSNIYINNHSSTGLMSYKIGVDYSKGVFPSKITIIIPSVMVGKVDILLPANVGYIMETDPESGDLLYVINSPDAIGSFVYDLSFPEGLEPTRFDISYKLDYYNPSLGANDSIYALQSFIVKAVGVVEDVDVGNAFVVSSAPNGMNLKTGSGDDVLTLGGGVNTIFTNSGNDIVLSGVLHDNVNLGDGDDWYWASIGFDFVDGGDGDDYVYYDNHKVDLQGLGDSFKQDFFNTFVSYAGITGHMGFDKGSLYSLATIYAMPNGIREQLNEFGADGGSLLGNVNSFSYYKNISNYVLSGFADKITGGDYDPNLLRVDGSSGRDTFILSESFNAANDLLGGVFDFSLASTFTGYDNEVGIFAMDKDGTAGRQYFSLVGFEVFFGDFSNDIFYSYYQSGYASNPSNAYMFYGSPVSNDSSKVDFDILSYTKLDRGGVEIGVAQGVVWKHFGGVFDATDFEMETFRFFEAIEGSVYYDLIRASASSTDINQSLYYLDSDVSASSGQDIITYEDSKVGVTVDLNSLYTSQDNYLYVYKSNTINSLASQDLSTFLSDKISSNALDANNFYFIIYTSGVDTFFSMEDRDITTGGMNAINGGGGSDILTYADFSDSIQVYFKAGDYAMVYKSPNGSGNYAFSDSFNYYTYTSYQGFVGSNGYETINIGKIIGTKLQDEVLIDYYMIASGTHIAFDMYYEAYTGGMNTDGSMDILRLQESSSLVDYAKQGFIINLGLDSFIESYDYTGNGNNSQSVRYHFTGINTIFGSKGADILLFDSSIKNIEDINSYVIDLADGSDTVNYSALNLVTNNNVPYSLSVSFDLATMSLKVSYGYWSSDDYFDYSNFVDSGNLTEFLHLEKLVGTVNSDYFFGINGMDLGFDGSAGVDIADYSDLSGGLEINFAMLPEDGPNVQKFTNGTVDSEDYLSNVEIVIGSENGDNNFYGYINGPIQYFVLSTALNSNSSLSYSSVASGVAITYADDGSALIEKNISGQPDNVDSINANSGINVIYGSNYGDSFVLYKLLDGQERNIYGYDIRVTNTTPQARNVIDVADLSFSQEGLNADFTSKDDQIDISFSNGSIWHLYNITGLLLTTLEDTVILNSSSSFKINAGQIKDSVSDQFINDGSDDTVIYNIASKIDVVFRVDINLASKSFMVSKIDYTNNVSSTDTLEFFEILNLSDKNDTLTLIGSLDANARLNAIKLVDASGGDNTLSLDKITTDSVVSFSSKNNALVYDKNNQSDTSITFLNFGSYYGSSSSVTTFLIGYTDTTSDYNEYLDLSGSNSQSQGKMTVIEFDSSVYKTGLYIDLSKFDPDSIAYLKVSKNNYNGGNSQAGDVLINGIHYFYINKVLGTDFGDTFIAGFQGGMLYDGKDNQSGAVTEADILSYANIPVGVGSGLLINLEEQSVTIQDYVVDTYANIEKIIGSDKNDGIILTEESSKYIIDVDMGSVSAGDYVVLNYKAGVIYDLQTGLPSLDISKIQGADDLILTDFNDTININDEGLNNPNTSFGDIYATKKVYLPKTMDTLNIGGLLTSNRIILSDNLIYVADANGAKRGQNFYNFNTIDQGTALAQTYVLERVLSQYSVKINASSADNILDFTSKSFTNFVIIEFGDSSSKAYMASTQSYYVAFTGRFSQIKGSNYADTFKFNSGVFSNSNLNLLKIDGASDVANKVVIDINNLVDASLTTGVGADILKLSSASNALEVELTNIQKIEFKDTGSSNDYVFEFNATGTRTYELIGLLDTASDSVALSNNQNYVLYSEIEGIFRGDNSTSAVLDKVKSFNSFIYAGTGSATYSFIAAKSYNVEVLNDDQSGKYVTIDYSTNATDMNIVLGSDFHVDKVVYDSEGNKTIYTDVLGANIDKVILSGGNNTISIDVANINSSIFNQDLIIDMGSGGNNLYNQGGTVGVDYDINNLNVGSGILGNGNDLTILNYSKIVFGSGNDSYTGASDNAGKVVTIDGGLGVDTLDYSKLAPGTSVNFYLNSGYISKSSSSKDTDYVSGFEIYKSGDGDDTIVFDTDSFKSLKYADLGAGRNSVNFNFVTSYKGDLGYILYDGIMDISTGGNVKSSDKYDVIVLANNGRLNDFLHQISTLDIGSNENDFTYITGSTGGNNSKYGYTMDATKLASTASILVEDSDEISIFSRSGSSLFGITQLVGFGRLGFNIQNGQNLEVSMLSASLRSYAVASNSYTNSTTTMNYDSTLLDLELSITKIDTKTGSVSAVVSNVKDPSVDYTLDGFNKIILGSGRNKVDLSVDLAGSSAGQNYLTIDGSLGADDTVNYNAGPINLTLSAGGSLTFEGYNLIGFEYFGLSEDDDIVNIKDADIMVELNGNIGNDLLDYSNATNTGNYLVTEEYDDNQGIVWYVNFENISSIHVMKNFETIRMGNGTNNIYVVGSVPSSQVSKTFNIHFGKSGGVNSSAAGGSTFDASISNASLTKFDIVFGSGIFTAIANFNFASKIMNVYKLNNITNIVGTSGNDQYKLNLANVSTSTNVSKPLVIDGKSGNDTVSFSGIGFGITLVVNMSSNVLIPTIVNLDMGSGGINFFQFYNIKSYIFGNEDTVVNASVIGSNTYDLGGGKNSFSYADPLNYLELTLQVNNGLLQHVFNKGGGNTDTVLGGLSEAVLTTGGDIINIYQNYLDKLGAINIYGNGGSDVLNITATDVTFSTNADNVLEIDIGGVSIHDVMEINLLDTNTGSLTLDLYGPYSYRPQAIYNISSNRRLSSLDLNFIANGLPVSFEGASINMITGFVRASSGGYDSTLNAGAVAYNLSDLQANNISLSLDMGIINIPDSKPVSIVLSDDVSNNLLVNNIYGKPNDSVYISVDLTNFKYQIDLIVLPRDYIKVSSSNTSSYYNVNSGGDYLKVQLDYVNEFLFKANGNTVFNNYNNANDISYISTGTANLSVDVDAYYDNRFSGDLTLSGAFGLSEISYVTSAGANVVAKGFGKYSFSNSNIIIDPNYAGGNVSLSVDNPNGINGLDVSSLSGATIVDISKKTIVTVNTMVYKYNYLGSEITYNITDPSSGYVMNLTGGNDLANVERIDDNLFIHATIDGGQSYDILNYKLSTNALNIEISSSGDGFSIVEKKANNVGFTYNNFEEINIEYAGAGLANDTFSIFGDSFQNISSILKINMVTTAQSGFTLKDGSSPWDATFKDGVFNGSINGQQAVQLSGFTSYIVDSASRVTVYDNNSSSSRPIDISVQSLSSSSTSVLDLLNLPIAPGVTEKFQVTETAGTKNVAYLYGSDVKYNFDNFHQYILQTTPDANRNKTLDYYSGSSSITTDHNSIFKSVLGVSIVTITDNTTYRLDDIVGGQLTLKVVKNNNNSTYDQLQGTWMDTYSHSQTLTIGNANYDSMFLMSVGLKEGQGLLVGHQLSTQEDTLNVIGFQHNLIIDTGKGHDNVNLNNEEYYYTVITQDTIVIDGVSYNTGGEMVILSNGAGLLMYLFNTGKDEIYGGSYVTNEEFYEQAQYDFLNNYSSSDRPIIDYNSIESYEAIDAFADLRPSNSFHNNGNIGNNGNENTNSQDTINNEQDPFQENVQSVELENTVDSIFENLLSQVDDIVSTSQGDGIKDEAINLELEEDTFDNILNLDNLDSGYDNNNILSENITLSQSNNTVDTLDIVDNYKLSHEEASDSIIDDINHILQKHNHNNGNVH